MNKKPLVSVTIPTLDRSDVLRETLVNLQRQTYSNLEIVVVDSSRNDETAVMVRKDFPNVKLVRLSKPTYYVAAFNVAWANCTGKYILMLDDDSFPGVKSLDRAIREMEKSPEIGVVAFGILNYDTYYKNEEFTRFTLDDYSGTGTEVFGFSGCGALVRRSTFQKYGHLSELTGMEDVPELHTCIRTWNEGMQIKAVKDIFVFHHLSQIGKPAEQRGSKKAMLDSATAMGLFYIRYFNKKDMLRRLALWSWALCNGAVVHLEFRYLYVIFTVLSFLPKILPERNPFVKEVTDKVRLPNFFRGL